MNAGILLMLAILGVVLMGFVALIVYLARRAAAVAALRARPAETKA